LEEIEMALSPRSRIVIVGAGFGGLAAAQALNGADADVILIDRTNHHLFQPLLYQVATAALSSVDIATATRALLRRQANATVLMSEVVGIDPAGKRVTILGGQDVDYDFLVVATGAAYSYFGHDEWARYSRVLKTLDDATGIRRAILGAFERAEGLRDPEEIRRLLTFVVVGGGPTGVELAGNIAELARSTLARDFRHINPASARVILCEGGAKVLGEFPDRLSAYTKAALSSLGVEVRLHTQVTDIGPQGLMAGGEWIDTPNVFWAAGTAARPAARWMKLEPGHNGAVSVDANCAVIGLKDVFAIGDVSSQTDAAGRRLPGLAAVAKQQGTYIGKLLSARLKGSATYPPFRYRDLGTLAVIGRSRAVARLPGVSLTGTVAWLIWSLVHLFLLVDFRSRLAVYVNWTWSWFTYGRGARLMIGAPAPNSPSPADTEPPVP
jgi:NADH:ubiquinone reductase (H+-translocating)